MIKITKYKYVYFIKMYFPFFLLPPSAVCKNMYKHILCSGTLDEDSVTVSLFVSIQITVKFETSKLA